MLGFNQITPEIWWFFGVFFITVAPVLRFRENFLVPMQAMLLSFGFYTQAFWMPDFFNLQDWLWIIVICSLILVSYFICGWIVHYMWGKGRLSFMADKGAFLPLLKAWIIGKSYQIEDDYIVEIRRLKIFDLKWDDVSEIFAYKTSEGEVTLILKDDVKREAEILSQFAIEEKSSDFGEMIAKLTEKFPNTNINWQDLAAQSNQDAPYILYKREDE